MSKLIGRKPIEININDLKNGHIPIYNKERGLWYTISTSSIAEGISGSKLELSEITASALLITTDAYIQGRLTATEYYSTVISSSIIYQSGSTKFGDTLDDTHQFTGSVLVDGNIEAPSITGSFKGDGSQLTGLVTDLRISGSTGTDIVSLLTDDLTVAGINGIVTTVTDNTITIDVPVALTSSLFGTASFATIADNFTIVNSGIYDTGSDSYVIPSPSGGLIYVTNADYAISSSYASFAASAIGNWNTLINKPQGLVSSSTQITITESQISDLSHTDISALNNFTSSQAILNQTFATTGSNTFIGNQVITGSLTISGSATLKNIGPTIFSGSLNVVNGITGSINYTNIVEVPEGLVSGSGQIIAALPSGLVSSSEQLPQGLISSSIQISDSLPSGLISASSQVSYTELSNLPSGLYSSSAQLPSGIISSSTQLPAGIVSSSAQLPSGLVSSSTQLPSGILSSSTQVVDSLPAGLVSSSAQLPAGTVSSSIQVLNYNTFATTGSNTFVGNQVVSGAIFFEGGSSITGNVANLELFADPSGEIILQQGYEFLKVSSQKVMATNIEAISVTGSFSGSLIGTSSWAENAATASLLLGSIDSASYATTASYALVAAVEVPVGTVSSSTQIDYTQIPNTPTTIPTASYVDYGNVGNKPTLVSASSQVSYIGLSNIPNGIVSASSQVDVRNTTGISTIATTGSNTLTGIQTISNTTNSTNYTNGALIVQGGVGITKDVYISGSVNVTGVLTVATMSTQYVTSSQVLVANNKILIGTDDVTRFGGISVYDSGSSSPTTASIYWDGFNHKFIYENLSGSGYNSAIFIAGPKNTATLGNEVGLVDYRVPVAHGSDHIDSRIESSSIRVDFPSRMTHVEAGLTVTGSIAATAGITGSFTGSIQLTGPISGTTLDKLDDVQDYTRSTITDGFQLAWNSGSQLWTPTAGAAAKGVTRLFISANRSNANAFYFTSIQLTSDNSSSPDATTAFMLTSALLSKVTIYLRQDGSTAGGTNSTLVRLEKNANGTAFSGATAIASQSLALTQNTVQTFTFSSLTLNQFDSLHIYCDPTNNPGQLYGIVTIE